MKRLVLLLSVLLLAGCAPQRAYLIDIPEQTPQATAEVLPTATPEPVPLVIAPIEGEGFTADGNGLPILHPETHYFDYYLTISNLRIYEQNEETLIDAVIVNSLTKPVSGGLRIVFTDTDGIQYGYGDFYTASGTLKLMPGENRVYCDVLTEVDVQQMAFAFEIVTPFLPEQ